MMYILQIKNNIINIIFFKFLINNFILLSPNNNLLSLL